MIKYIHERRRTKRGVVDLAPTKRWGTDVFILPFDSRSLDIRPTTLVVNGVQGAFNGLFAKRRFVAGEFVAPYGGKCLTAGEVKDFYGEDVVPYGIDIRSPLDFRFISSRSKLNHRTRTYKNADKHYLTLDALKYTGAGALCNHHMDENQRNAQLTEDSSGMQTYKYVVATKEILPGQEIFVDYGGKYVFDDHGGFVDDEELPTRRLPDGKTEFEFVPRVDRVGVWIDNANTNTDWKPGVVWRYMINKFPNPADLRMNEELRARNRQVYEWYENTDNNPPLELDLTFENPGARSTTISDVHEEEEDERDDEEEEPPSKMPRLVYPFTNRGLN